MLKKNKEWATWELCFSFHKELLQGNGIMLLVLQWPSGSLAGQKPHVDHGSLRFVSFGFTVQHMFQDAGLQTLVVSTVLISGEWRSRTACWDTGCHRSSHTVVLMNTDLVTHPKVFSFLSYLLGVSKFPPASPSLGFTSFTMAFFVNYWNLSITLLGFTGSRETEFPKHFLLNSQISSPSWLSNL